METRILEHRDIARRQHRDPRFRALADAVGDEHHRMAEHILQPAHDQAQGLSRVLRPPRPPEMREQQHDRRSEEHTSELQSLMRISYAVFCLKKKQKKYTHYGRTQKTE